MKAVNYKFRASDQIWWDSDKRCYVVTSTRKQPSTKAQWLGRYDQGVWTALYTQPFIDAR